MNKTKSLGNINPKGNENKKRNFKWRSMLALALMYVVIIFEVEWIWGVLFSFWVLQDIISGTTYFVEEVKRKTNPIEYWIIVGSWILMTLYSISTLF